LVLHFLRKRLARKVKLIYTDPPYNTGMSRFNKESGLLQDGNGMPKGDLLGP